MSHLVRAKSKVAQGAQLKSKSKTVGICCLSSSVRMKKLDISSGGTSVGNELSRSRSESARNTIGIHYTKDIINTCYRVSSAKKIYEIVERSKPS
jgi:hypothetical protein